MQAPVRGGVRAMWGDMYHPPSAASIWRGRECVQDLYGAGHPLSVVNRTREPNLGGVIMSNHKTNGQVLLNIITTTKGYILDTCLEPEVSLN